MFTKCKPLHSVTYCLSPYIYEGYNYVIVEGRPLPPAIRSTDGNTELLTSASRPLPDNELTNPSCCSLISLTRQPVVGWRTSHVVAVYRYSGIRSPIHCEPPKSRRRTVSACCIRPTSSRPIGLFSDTIGRRRMGSNSDLSRRQIVQQSALYLHFRVDTRWSV